MSAKERNESEAICLLFCKWRFAIDCILEDKLQHCQNAKYKDSIKHYIRNKRHAIESCRAKLSERHDQCR